MNFNLFDNTEKQSSSPFPTQFNEILEKVKQINPSKYAQTRNFINGAVTYLSPYISRGVISGKLVLDQISKKGYDKSTIEKLVQELAWREYYQRIWQHQKEAIWTDLKQDQPGVDHHQMITSVVEANTSIEAIDTAIKKLYQTGYMHNHVRMYTAALVCNIGKAHWSMPAKWMYYHLLDGDMASNNCSWQWVAAAFSSKKYYFNQDNVNKFTFSKQQGTFIDDSYESIMDMSVPKKLMQTAEFSATTVLPSTQPPPFDSNLPTLIYNGYNLDPSWHEGEQANRILLLEPAHFEKYPVSEKVINFILELAKNIKGIQLFTGEINQIVQLYPSSTIAKEKLISKEHPLFTHYPGIKENRDWMFPEVNGLYPSFFSYWNKCSKYL